MNEPQNAEDSAALPNVESTEPIDVISNIDLDEDIVPVLPADQDQPNFVLEWLKGGHPFLAWFLILCLVIGIPILRQMRTPDAPAGPDSQLRLFALTLQSKMMVGMYQLLPDRQFVQQLDSLNVGPVDQRLGYVALVGELAGPKVAQEKLTALNEKLLQSGHVLLPRDAMAMNTLEQLYANHLAGTFDDPTIDETRRRNLRNTVGWIGELVLAPSGGPNEIVRQKLLSSAKTFCLLCIAGVLLAALAAFAGVIGLILLCIFMFAKPGARSVRAAEGSGGIYAETFALWMFVFLVFGFASHLVQIEGAEMLIAGVATLTTLVTLTWPVLRGIPWKQVREDIGLTGGSHPLVEAFFGPVGYAVTLPLLFVGVVIVFGLMRLQGLFASNWGELLPIADEFSPATNPAHPIVEFLAGPGISIKLQILFLGSVVAPIVEEIMFRGVLYRHLRNATGRWSLFWSFLTSGLIVSFVFAVIHPQGLVAVPALMGLAMGFTLMRQWRGSLISSMVAHGINNGLIMSLAILVFSS